MKKAIEFKRANKGENKKLVNGCQSIYLDIYMNGRRQYEFLKLYIIPEHNQADKKRNVETLNLANAIKAQKILEIYNQTYGFNHNRLSNMKLTGYMKLIAEQSVNNRVRKKCHTCRCMPFGKIYSEWNIAKEGGQDLFVGFYRLLEENKTRTW